MRTAEYSEGGALAIVRGATVVVLPEPVDADLVTRLWETLADGGTDGATAGTAPAGVVAVVGVLTQAAGDLTGVPPFAVATLDAGTARVAVRGEAVAVRVATASGSVEVSGGDVLMWAERVIPGATSIEVSGPGAADGDARWPLQAGAVRASTVALAAEAPVEAFDWPVPGQRAAGAPAPKKVAVPVVEATGHETMVGPDDGEPPVSEETVLGSDGEGDGYEHLFGDTVYRQVEDAAVRDLDEDAGPPLQQVEAAQPPPAAVGPGPSEPVEPSPAPDVPDDPGALDDHDGHTIMSGELAALRAAAAPAPPEATPPAGAHDVQALTCPLGHPNPPTRESCRTCLAPLAGEPHQVPRPPLGRVLVSVAGGDEGSGQTIELDRDVVVGRRPRTSTASADRMPRMVTVDSPQQDISRSHVEISLDRWSVLVEDLATTNGTVLLRSGQDPRRLHPHQKEVVVAGDVVELGDGVSLTFGDIW